MIILDEPTFTLTFENGRVSTRYKDNHACLVRVNNDHKYHAKLLGITPEKFNLSHEVGHHLVGQAYKHESCPIIWASAHNQPMPEEADRLEWQITALQYFALRTNFRHQHEWSAISLLAQVCDVWKLSERLAKIIE